MKIIKIIVWGLCGFFCFASPLFSAEKVLVFEAESCPHCMVMKEKFFKPLVQKYPGVKFVFYELAEPDNFRLFIKLSKEKETSFHGLPEELPYVFWGDKVFNGEKEIKNKLPGFLAESGSGANPVPSEKTKVPPTDTGKKTGQIFLAYFYEPGCKKCSLYEPLLSYLKKEYPDIIIKRFDASAPENKILLEACGEGLRVPENIRLITPSLYLSNHFFQKKLDLRLLEKALEEERKAPENKPVWEKTGTEIESAKLRITGRFEKLGWFTIVSAGLIDGINPCAFATLIFLIVYLSALKKKGKEIILIGSLFTLAVFLTYLLFGVGLLPFVNFIRKYRIFEKIFLWLTALFVFVLGILSLKDFFISRKGGWKEINLKLPEKLRSRIHSAILRMNRKRFLVFSSLALGFVVTCLEAVCTGQVYLPTIILVSQISFSRHKAITYLIGYNIFFVLPLIAVFAVFYSGVRSERFADFFQRQMHWAKLFLALLFFGFAAVFIYLSRF